ncbi:MAG TPA: hypothetical protein VMW87_16685 [Spirochaetia bacterium]|nr:hypothetical protein [Spirochaetia bacterium]
MDHDDIIDRLMTVEREAESLVGDAQAETDRLLREAEQTERQHHEEAVAEKQHTLARELEEQKKTITAARVQETERFRSDLESRQVDQNALFSEIDAILKSRLK